MRFCFLSISLACAAAVTQAQTPVFTQIASMNEARNSHTATLLEDGRVLVTGGGSQTFVSLRSAELYNPTTGTWRYTAAPMSVPRAAHTASLLENGKVLIAGGFDGSNDLGSAEIFDPATETFQLADSLSQARRCHKAVVLSDGRVMVIGGYVGLSGATTGAVEIFDINQGLPGKGKWAAAASLPAGRVFMSATLLGGGRVLVAGGLGGQWDVQASVILYDLSSNSWAVMSPLLAGRQQHAAAALLDGKVLITAGTRAAVGNDVVDSVEVYDVAAGPSGQSVFTTPIPGARQDPNLTSIRLGNGNVLVIGGHNNATTGFVMGAQLFSPTTRTWSDAGTLNIGRACHTATSLASGKVLVAGGVPNSFTGGGAINTAEIWDSGPPPPVINAGGTVNGASFRAGAAVAPGSIASVFGSSLALATASASATPLPATLGGASADLGGNGAPLFFVSSGQINIQVPWELAGQTQARLTITAGGVTSNPQTVSLATFAPGIFQLANGQGAILIANTATVAAPVASIAGSQARPANPGEFITIYCTGLGPVTNQPPTAAPASGSPLSVTTTTPAVSVGNIPGTVSFSGLAPGFVGLYQVDVQIPANAPLGSAVPVTVQVGSAVSNSVTVAIASSTTGGLSVQVSPNPASLITGQRQQFTANVTNTANKAVNWAVNGVSGGNSAVGTVSASGLYTAPDFVPNPPSVTITATSQADSSKSGSAQVSLAYAAPHISSFSPDAVPVGSSDTAVSITGQGFSRASIASLDGQSLTTTYVSGTEINATVPSGSLTLGGTHALAVSNPTPGGGTSTGNELLTVTNLRPAIRSVTPSVAVAGGSTMQISILGNNFLPASTVELGGAGLTSAYITATQLVAAVPSTSLRAPAVVSLTVSNPAPGGGASLGYSFTVTADPTAIDVEPRDQDGTPDPEAPTIVVGPPESGAKLGSTSPQAALSVADSSGSACTFDGPTAGFNGACVPGVPWMSQIPPGDDIWQGWCQTGNCSLASLAIVDAFYHRRSDPNYNDTLELVKFLTGTSCGAGAKLFSCLGTCHSTDPSSLCSTLPKPSSAIDPFYGPTCGLSEGDTAKLASKHLPYNAESATRSVTASASINDQLAPLFCQLQQGHPVIVHVRYKMGLCNQCGTPGQYCASCSGHYMVLVGIDYDPAGYVYVVDPGVSVARREAEFGNYSSSMRVGAAGDPKAQVFRYTKELFLKNWREGNKDDFPNGRYGFVIVVPAAESTQCPAFGIVQKSLRPLPQGRVGDSYSAVYAARGGVPPYQWSVAAGRLPDGLVLDPLLGAITGTARTAGTFEFTVAVTDSDGHVASGISSITVGASSGGLMVTTPGKLPTAKVGAHYDVPLTAAGGPTPYLWSQVDGSLPDGLVLGSEGRITGTPATPALASFTVRVTDGSKQSVTKNLSITVVASDMPPVVSSITADPMTVSPNAASIVRCNAYDPEGSNLAYAWTATGGTLSGSGSAVVWTAPSQAGQYTLKCSVSEASGGTDSRSVIVAVSPPGLLSLVTPSSGIIGVTQFVTSGSKATPNGQVISRIALPGGAQNTRKVTATNTGQYAFPAFTATEAGIYTEVDSDDATGAKSNTVAWKVDASTGIDLNATPSCPSGQPQVQLSWTTVGASSYAVYRNGSLYAPGIATGSFVDGSNLVPGGSYTYSVKASLASGGTQDSNPVRVTIPSGCTVAQAPSISGVSPPSMPASNSNQTLTINGSNFQNGATLAFVPPAGGTIASTASKLTFVSSSQLSYQFNNLSDAGTWSVTVNNPDGQHSNAWNFTATQAAMPPDLVPSGLVVSLTTVQAGQALSFSFTVRNAGSGGVTITTTTRVRLSASASAPSPSDPLLASLSTSPLAAGASVPLSGSGTVPSTLAAGTYYVWVIVDADDLLTSQGQNTANDRISTPVTVTQAGGTPDLVPSGLVVSPTTVQAGQTVTFSFTMSNQGAGAAAATTTRLRLNQNANGTSTSDVSLGDVSTPALAAGASTTLNATLTIPSGTAAGTYYVWVVADNGTVLNQSNVQNDYARSGALTVTGSTQQPDLIPSNAQLSSTSLTAGGSVTVTVTVKNQGTGNAGATTTMIRLNNNSSSSSPSDPMQQGVATPAISAGSSTTVSASFTLSTAGTYYAHVYVDNYGVLNQSSVSNDSYHSQAITVAAATQPDLVVQGVSLSSSSLQVGATVTVTVTVRNQGTGPAGATTTMVRLNTNPSSSTPPDPLQQGLSTPAIAAGGSAQVSANFTLSAAGTYYVHVYVDNYSVLTQSDPTNDSYHHSQGITVTGATPAPSISWVSPNPVTGSNSAQPFTINGSGFTAQSTVTLRDKTASQVFANRPISLQTPTQIVINPVFTTAAHTWSAEVLNASLSSGEFTFQVR